MASIVYCLDGHCSLRERHFHCPFDACDYVFTVDKLVLSKDKDCKPYKCKTQVEFPCHFHCKICNKCFTEAVYDEHTHVHCDICNYIGDHIHCDNCSYVGTRAHRNCDKCEFIDTMLMLKNHIHCDKCNRVDAGHIHCDKCSYVGDEQVHVHCDKCEFIGSRYDFNLDGWGTHYCE